MLPTSQLFVLINDLIETTQITLAAINYSFYGFELNKITNPNKSQVELNQDGQIQVDESLDLTQDNNSLVANIGSPVSDGELFDEANDSSITTAEVEVLENGTASELVRFSLVKGFVFILRTSRHSLKNKIVSKVGRLI